MKTKLVIFDCDGVLVDSEPISNRIIAEELTARGLATSQATALELFAGGSLSRVDEYFKSQTGQDIDADFEPTYRSRTHQAFEEELQAVAGAEEMLKAIALAKCVGSNGPLHKIQSNLDKTGLRHFFDERLYSAYTIRRWKPKPDLYLHAAKEMAYAPEECVVVEDSLHGVEAAVAAGMTVFGYTGTKSAKALQAAGAIPFDDMLRLPELIQHTN